MTVAPNPNPVLFGSCTSCGTRMNDEYMPTPSRTATRFVVHTPFSRIIRMSTSGSSARSSAGIHSSTSKAPSASSASVRPDVQPQVLPSLIASSTPPSPADMSSAPSQLIFPGVLTGDSGT